MKSNQIDFTEEYDDLLKVTKLGKFLYKLKVEGATQLISGASDLHSNTFCDDCERYRDDCNCSGYRDYDMYDDGADYED